MAVLELPFAKYCRTRVSLILLDTSYFFPCLQISLSVSTISVSLYSIQNCMLIVGFFLLQVVKYKIHKYYSSISFPHSCFLLNLSLQSEQCNTLMLTGNSNEQIFLFIQYNT